VEFGFSYDRNIQPFCMSIAFYGRKQEMLVRAGADQPAEKLNFTLAEGERIIGAQVEYREY